MRAVSYGYHPKEIEVPLREGETVSYIIKLDPMATGTIRGRVYDRVNNNPVTNATVRLLEEPNVAVTTDSNGNFVIQDDLKEKIH